MCTAFVAGDLSSTLAESCHELFRLVNVLCLEPLLACNVHLYKYSLTLTLTPTNRTHNGYHTIREVQNKDAQFCFLKKGYF